MDTTMHRVLADLMMCLSIVSFTALADPYPVDNDIDISHYRFELALSDNSDEIIGLATVHAEFLAPGINRLRLDLVNKTTERKGRGMQVHRVSQGNTALNFVHEDDALHIELASSAPAGEILEFRISYSGIPATGLKIGENKYGDRTFFSDNWPNKARHWLPTVDHISDKATSEILITAPSHYQVVSNGLLQEQTDLGNDMRLTHWKQSVPIAPWLYVMGAADFAVQYVDEFDHKSIQTWVYRQDRDAGFYDFAVPTRQALEYFSNYVGPFVYEKLANIQSNSVGGGMEAASAILYGDDSVTGERTDRWQYVIVHEIAHQWFGNSVTEASWDDVWLSEGFATYFSHLYFEHADGHDVFVTSMNDARQRIFEFDAENPAYRIVHDNLDDMSRVTTRQTYDKGAWVLHMLKNKVGNEIWWTGIRNYYRKYINSHATTREFREQMEMACNCNLEQFFDQWLFQGGNLKLAGEWWYDTSSETVEIYLAQETGTDVRFAVDIEIGVFAENDLVPSVHTTALTSGEAHLSIPLAEPPTDVVIDPRSVLLAQWTLTENPK